MIILTACVATLNETAVIRREISLCCCCYVTQCIEQDARINPHADEFFCSYVNGYLVAAGGIECRMTNDANDRLNGDTFLPFPSWSFAQSTESQLTVRRKLPSFRHAVAYLRERRKRESAHEPRKDCLCTLHSHRIAGFSFECTNIRTCWSRPRWTSGA